VKSTLSGPWHAFLKKGRAGIKRIEYEDPVEKVIFCRLIKNAQMQGARNPESGVATSKERLLATPPRR